MNNNEIKEMFITGNLDKINHYLTTEQLNNNYIDTDKIIALSITSKNVDSFNFVFDRLDPEKLSNVDMFFLAAETKSLNMLNAVEKRVKTGLDYSASIGSLIKDDLSLDEINKFRNYIYSNLNTSFSMNNPTIIDNNGEIDMNNISAYKKGGTDLNSCFKVLEKFRNNDDSEQKNKNKIK